MKKQFRHILLTGGTGQLGQQLVSSGLFPQLLTPTHKILDLCQDRSVEKYFNAHPIDAVIHTAALARMREAEKDPVKTMQTNLMGTCRLVEHTIRAEKREKKAVRFIHISTDGVYPSIRGRYKETDPTIPYNRYGWTKLGAECAVNLLRNFCIIRTRFFDPARIPFKTHAIDSYSSSVPLADLAQAIYTLLHSEFIGTINVGGKRLSDYTRYKEFSFAARPCRLKDILPHLPFVLSHDASLDCRLWKNIKRQSGTRKIR